MSNLYYEKCPLCERQNLKSRPSNQRTDAVACTSCGEIFVDVRWRPDPTDENRVLCSGRRRNPEFTEALSSGDVTENIKTATKLIREGIKPTLDEEYFLGYEDLGAAQ